MFFSHCHMELLGSSVLHLVLSLVYDETTCYSRIENPFTLRRVISPFIKKEVNPNSDMTGVLDCKQDPSTCLQDRLSKYSILYSDKREWDHPYVPLSDSQAGHGSSVP